MDHLRTAPYDEVRKSVLARLLMPEHLWTAPSPGSGVYTGDGQFIAAAKAHYSACDLVQKHNAAVVALQQTITDLEWKVADTEYQDSIVERIQEIARAAGNVDHYAQCPTELMVDLVNQRDEARDEVKLLTKGNA